MKITWRDKIPCNMQADGAEVSRRVQILETVLRNTTRDGSFSNKKYCSSVDCDEVYPNIWIGDWQTAKNKKFLKKIGITHLVNASIGNQMYSCNTDAHYYKSEGIMFLGLNLLDLPHVDISQYFTTVSDFIEVALASKGKVFVHCFMGISRSSTCVIAFLMLKRGMTAEEAVRQVRSHRHVAPNEGFLRQLAKLDIKLQDQKDLAEYEKTHTV